MQSPHIFEERASTTLSNYTPLPRNSLLGTAKYQLSTVTYGLSCPLHLALQVIQQLVKDEGRKIPNASKTLLASIYMKML